MSDSFLVDTSVLRVFSSIRRLDLLESWSPFHVTQNILREHGQAPPQAQTAVTQAINANQILLADPAVEYQVKLLDEKLGLGYVDCEGILVAERDGLAGIFVADRNYREACKKRGIQTTSVGPVLLYLVKAKELTKADAFDVATSMESSQYYQFPTEERARLGLPR